MNKKSLIVTLATFALVSCGNNNMPKITEDRAIELASEIIAHQSNPQIFAQPENFVYNYNGKTTISFNSSEGKYEGEETHKHIFKIDMNNLVLYDYTKDNSSHLVSEVEEVIYYDKTGVLRTLINKNGDKTRTEEQLSADKAKEQFGIYREDWKNTYTWNKSYSLGTDPLPFALSDYQTRLAKYQGKRELYKNEKDQYCNIYVGSNDAKSLQTTVEVKEKESDESTSTGYSTYNCSTFIKNDLFSSCKVNSNYDVKNKENEKFYWREKDIAESEMTYGNAKINIPNYLDYKLED